MEATGAEDPGRSRMKFYLESLGCAKNLVDSEIAVKSLEDAGYVQTRDAGNADVIIVNTCAFIKSAKEEAIGTILDLSSFKEEGRTRLVVMGCLPERYRDELPGLLPEVDLWTGTRDIHRLPALLEARDCEVFSRCEVPYEDLPRRTLTPAHWAYLKISEGCNHRCTFCAIPSIRGPYRSRSMRSIMREADTLAAQGVREIVLISQDSMAYGCDLAGKPGLSSLLTSLASIEKIEWIRFLYCNPEAVSGDLLKVMAGEQKICPYLDIPLQHVSAPVLKAMRRPGSYGSFMKLIERVRKIIPGITLRSTFIVGFPGEGSEDYMQLLAFLEEARLDRVGIFAWSREEGTAAWGIKPRVPTRVAKARLKEAMLLQQRISLEKNRGLIGSVLEVIADGPLEGKPDMRGLVQEAGGVIRRAKLAVSGRSRADAPEVDGKVFFSGEARAGEIVPVRISGVTPYDCFGELMLKG